MLGTSLAQSGSTPDASGEFTSAAALSARQRYLSSVADAQQKFVGVLKQVQMDVMRAGQLDEANRITKVIADPGHGAADLTSLRAKAAQAAYLSAVQRAGKQYQIELKVAMAQNLKAGQLEEANRLSQEMKRLDAANAQLTDPVTGFINLIPSLKPDTDTVAGKWVVENGALVSSGKGEERIQIPYRPPAEYDFKITFTKVSGENCILQLLAEDTTPFIWCIGINGHHTFRYLKGTGIGSNKTSVQGELIRSKDRHTSLVRVRKNGAEALLDGKVVSKWSTDYSDVDGNAPWWLLKDHSLLGVAAADAHTIFHTIEVKEVSGPGKFLR